MSRVLKKRECSDVSDLRPAGASGPEWEGVEQFEPRQVKISTRRPTPQAAGVSGGLPKPIVDVRAGEPDEPDIEAIQRQAFQHGHAEGERAGVERATAQYREAVENFARSAVQVATLKPRLRAEGERELVELAFAIARRIMRREVSVDPTVVAGLVRGCLDEYTRSEINRLLVHPLDHQVVTEVFEKDPLPQLEIVADKKVTRGGAIFETTRGTLDARLETQLDEIEKGLTDR